MNTIKKIKNIFNLKGKNILIIGGGGYLGFAMSEGLVEMGANVIIASRNKKNIKSKIELLNSKFENKSEFLQLDISSSKSIDNFYTKLTRKYKKINVLINCAWNGKKNTLESITNEDWDNDIDISLSSTFKITKKIIPMLKKTNGKIINIASMYGHVAPDYRIYENNSNIANPPSYGAAKAGVIQLTRYLSSFLAPFKINVNSISPGAFPFKKIQIKFPGFIKKLKKKTPLNRIGAPEDLKGVVVLLSSNSGNYITGQNFCVDGGWSVW